LNSMSIKKVDFTFSTSQYMLGYVKSKGCLESNSIFTSYHYIFGRFDRCPIFVKNNTPSKQNKILAFKNLYQF